MTAQPLDYAQAKEGARKIAERRRGATGKLETAIKEAAAAEAEYRKSLSRRIVELRDAGVAATACEAQAKGEDGIAFLLAERDVKAGMIAVQQSHISEIEGERASFHRLMEWSMKLNAMGVQ